MTSYSREKQLAGHLQVVHTSAALQSDRLASLGLNKPNALLSSTPKTVSKRASNQQATTLLSSAQEIGAGNATGAPSVQFKSSFKQKSAFTRNIEAIHDRNAQEQLLRGGSQPKFTAQEAEKGRQRVHKSIQRTITSVVNHQQAHHHGSSFGEPTQQTQSLGKNRHSSPIRSTVNGDGREGLPNQTGVTRQTNIAANRQNCVGESELADRTSFENRVREVMTMRNTGNVLNARVIETWINETLADAEHLDIPGVVLKPTQKEPLARYFVDRIHLISENVEVAAVDRIYRGLFVYSIGFYEMLHKSLQHAKNKYTILSAIWKVYSILLEYCCRSSYQMQLAQMHTEHQEALVKLQENFEFEIKQLSSNEKDLKLELDDLQKENSDLKRRLDDEIQLRVKLQEEIYKNIRSHEEEVQLRLQFESKLNGLHSLHRDLQAKYERALEDIHRLNLTNSAVQERYEKIEGEVINLRSLKIEHESKIAYNEERIRSMQVEIEQKVRVYNTIEAKLLKAQETIEEKNLLIKDQDQKMDQLQLIQESERAIINGLRSEKTHLELQLKENTALKEQFTMKCDQLQEMYETLFKETQQFKRQIVGVEEIKKDRDNRVKDLRAEVELLQSQLDKLTQEHAVLKVHARSLADDNARQRSDNEHMHKNLKTANDVRALAETSLTELQRQYRTMKDVLQDREEMLANYKHKFEEEQNKLLQIERKADTLEIEKKSLEKQNDIQRKQLLDKINQQTELIAAEKDTREIWINRYEKEQKTHIKTHSDYIKLRGEMQEMTLKFENQRTVSESLESIANSLKKSHSEVLAQLGKTQGENERLKREVATQKKLLQARQELNEQHLAELRYERGALEATHMEQVERHQMQYEDLRVMSHLHYERILHLEAVIEGLQEDLSQMTKARDDLEQHLARRNKEYDDLMEKFEKQTLELLNEKQSHRMQINENHRLEEEIKDLKMQISENMEKISDLTQNIVELEEQNCQHQKKQRELEEEIEKLKERLVNRKERWDVQIQTEFKTKSRRVQVDQMELLTGYPQEKVKGEAEETEAEGEANDKTGIVTSFGHISDDGQHFGDNQTVNSTNLLNSTQQQFKPQNHLMHHHSSQTNVFTKSNQQQSALSASLPRVQSAKRTGPQGGSASMMSLNHHVTQMAIDGPTSGKLVHNLRVSADGQAWMSGEMRMSQPLSNQSSFRRGPVQRPAKSAAANKYRHIMPTTTAIAEEIDYKFSGRDQNNNNILIGGFLQRPNIQTRNTSHLLLGDDMESVHYQPSGLQIQQKARRSAVRLKHNDKAQDSMSLTQMRKSAQNTVSHGAGVLIGNNFLQQHIERERQTTATMRSRPHGDLLREFANESKVSVGMPTGKDTLKSVYNMQVSHSNLAAKNAKIQSQHIVQAGSPTPNKRKHLQSAAQARTTRPSYLQQCQEDTNGSAGGRKSTAMARPTVSQSHQATNININTSALSQKQAAVNAASALSHPMHASVGDMHAHQGAATSAHRSQKRRGHGSHPRNAGRASSSRDDVLDRNYQYPSVSPLLLSFLAQK